MHRLGAHGIEQPRTYNDDAPAPARQLHPSLRRCYLGWCACPLACSLSLLLPPPSLRHLTRHRVQAALSSARCAGARVLRFVRSTINLTSHTSRPAPTVHCQLLLCLILGGARRVAPMGVGATGNWKHTGHSGEDRGLLSGGMFFQGSGDIRDFPRETRGKVLFLAFGNAGRSVGSRIFNREHRLADSWEFRRFGISNGFTMRGNCNWGRMVTGSKLIFRCSTVAVVDASLVFFFRFVRNDRSRLMGSTIWILSLGIFVLQIYRRKCRR